MPRYKNAGGQSREKCMVAAYALVTDFGASQSDAAAALKTRQPTVSKWVNEVRYQKQISELKKQLTVAKTRIKVLENECSLIGYDSDDEE